MTARTHVLPPDTSSSPGVPHTAVMPSKVRLQRVPWSLGFAFHTVSECDCLNPPLTHPQQENKTVSFASRLVHTATYLVLSLPPFSIHTTPLIATPRGVSFPPTFSHSQPCARPAHRSSHCQCLSVPSYSSPPLSLSLLSTHTAQASVTSTPWPPNHPQTSMPPPKSPCWPATATKTIPVQALNPRTRATFLSATRMASLSGGPVLLLP